MLYVIEYGIVTEYMSSSYLNPFFRISLGLAVFDSMNTLLESN